MRILGNQGIGLLENWEIAKLGFWLLVFVWSFGFGAWNFAYAGSWPDFSNGGGGSWLGGYYRSISVTNTTASTLTDYQVKITLTTAALGNPYSHIKADGSDIRFSTTLYGADIPYWIESWNNAGNSFIWVKVSNLPAGDSKIYMYYGNISATTLSNVTNTATANTTSYSYNGDNGLMGEWRFEDGAGTTAGDSSGNGNNGVFSGATWIGSSNIVPNSSFSLGNYFWNSPQGNMFIDTTFGRTDSYSWKSTYTTPVATVSSRLNVIGGSTVTVSGWMNSTGNSGRFGIDTYDSNGVLILNSDNYNVWTTASAGWQFFSQTWVLPANVYQIDIRFVSGENAPPAGTVVYWDDISITVLNSCSKFGGAVIFNGLNNYVTIPNSASLNVSNNMTIEAWVNPRTKKSSIILGKYWGRGGAGYGLDTTVDGILRVNLYAGGVYYDINSGAVLANGAWSHVVATYNGSNVAIYVNGSNVGNQAISGLIGTDANPLVIGKEGQMNQNYFDGTIDEVRIYNRTLTQSEIVAHYLGRKYVSPDPAVGGAGNESPRYTGSTVVTTTNWASLIMAGQKVAMGNAIAQAKFTMVVSGTATAHWKRFRVDKYARAGQQLIPDDKIVVQVWMENNGDGFFDAGDQMIAQGTFTNNTCYLNLNRWVVATTPKTYYIVYKFDKDCGGGQFAGVNIGDSSWLEFEDAIAVGVPP